MTLNEINKYYGFRKDLKFNVFIQIKFKTLKQANRTKKEKKI